MRLRPSVQALGQLTDQFAHHFTDIATEKLDPIAPQHSKKPGSPTYMLPVLSKRGTQATGSSNGPCLPAVGAHGRNLLRRCPDSRGTLKQSSAMLLDLGADKATSSASHLALASGGVPISGKKLRVSSSSGHLEFLTSSPSKATVRLPSLSTKPSMTSDRSQTRELRVNNISSRRAIIF